jgi:dihydrofolate reductase
MRHIANATYMSLDGVVQHPELWTFDYRSDDAAQVSHDQLFAADALIMGRHTYDIFAGHWPAATDPDGFADRMNTIPKYVLSRTLSKPSWTNTTVLAGDNVVDRIRALKQEPGQDILQYGYGPVTRLLIDHGLLDELHIWLHPLLVGNTDPGDHRRRRRRVTVAARRPAPPRLRLGHPVLPPTRSADADDRQE